MAGRPPRLPAMTGSRLLTLDGIRAPLLLGDAPEVERMIRAIMPGWPCAPGGGDAAPFFSIRRTGPAYSGESMITGAAPRELDALNAVCDMIAALSYALVASDPNVLCLHAAAVRMAGRLVVLPETRRAGKSTLTAALARAGHGVFTDDFLPVLFDADGRLAGRANGILPRLRLPLPETLDAGFRSWAEGAAGPSNGQYMYLFPDSLPPAGETAPLGAIVVPERQDGAAPALSPLSPEEAMDLLLFQNFTREIHSADVLRLLARMVESLPLWRLSYGEAPEAAALLSARFGDWPGPVPADPTLAGPLARADLVAEEGVGQVEMDQAYQRRPGAALAELGEAAYLADPEGGGIHRLNPMSRAVWTLLEQRISPGEVRDILAEAFPGTDPARIGEDVAGFMTRLSRARLILPA